MADDSNDPRKHPRDYDEPRTPEGTPPVVQPGEEGKKKKTGREPDDAARKGLEKRQRERADHEGAGEEELDSMRPETLFPPD
ncbi:MAG: hypothetical protein RIC51_01140 [Erythrobacter sp.]|uniref:hypothetical protein n=1 Tax=Erythrobacter sp. TaxID=1042 RepID=UPI0032EC7E09